MKSKRLPICAGLLTEYHDDFIKYRHFIIQHLKYDTLEIVSGLHDGGCNVGEVIAIDYSCDDDALNAVRQLGIAVAKERYERIAARLLQRVYQSDGHNLVLWDVGGYASVVCADPELCSKVKFCIEDTNNGLWAYQREPQLFCPVVDVASIGNKHVENGYVGKKIVEGVLQFFRENGLRMPSSDIVVVGFGGIGMSVCVALRLRGINPAVVDVDSGKLALARAMEFPVGRSVTNFPRASIVIGCTGTAAVNLDDLMRLTKKPYLVSGSSKQIEFGDVLRRGNITKCAHLTNSDVDVSTGAIIVNNGKPINFLYGSLNDEMSDFMYADILAAVIEGGRIQRPGIRKLSEEWQAEVARRWERHYL